MGGWALLELDSNFTLVGIAAGLEFVICQDRRTLLPSSTPHGTLRRKQNKQTPHKSLSCGCLERQAILHTLVVPHVSVAFVLAAFADAGIPPNFDSSPVIVPIVSLCRLLTEPCCLETELFRGSRFLARQRGPSQLLQPGNDCSRRSIKGWLRTDGQPNYQVACDLIVATIKSPPT